MTLLWVEGWDDISNTTGSGSASAVQEYMNRFYTHSETVGGGPQLFDGRLEGTAFTFGADADADQNNFNVEFESSSTVVLGFAYKPGEYEGTGQETFIEFYDCAGDADILQMEIEIFAGTSFIVKRGGTNRLDTILHVMKQDRWNYVEIKYTPHDTTGYMEMRVNESVIFTYSGDTNEGSSTVDCVRFVGVETPVATTDDRLHLWDDMYLLNSAGTTNNDFLGPIHVETILPNGIGSDNDFTAVGGLNWQNVDDVPTNDDGSYNTSLTVGDKDLFAAQTLSVVNGTIYGVKVNAEARVTEAGVVKILPKVKSGSTYGDGTTTGIASTEYIGVESLFETNPDTSTAWTVSEIQSINFGYEVG